MTGQRKVPPSKLPEGPIVDEMPELDSDKGERIAKVLARAGIASRRDAEKLIAEGRVVVNGQKLDSPAFFVTPEDRVTVNGTPVAAAERTRLFRYHKPRGLVTTHKDTEGRPTVFENLPAGLPRLVSVGRLDLTSEGLLLLTNDGALARKLELPANGWIRRYRARVHGKVEEAALAALTRGITVEGVKYGPIEAGLDSRRGANSWLTVSIQEGKNREVRRVLQHLGLHVTRLIRVAYGPFQLGLLPESGVEEVNAKVMRDQLGVDAAPRLQRGTERVAEVPEPVTKPARAPRARRAGDPQLTPWGAADWAAEDGKPPGARKPPRRGA
ncbi:23S rRNA pseudouridine2605 synthase [Humitalea rosea]|uniref:Pseudouridine synthase n=1 Tax=Humitalea rosea TaxID=990373 RepID=A0A2W7KH38_9PROT|nr:23S rRNA pseudouridine2605 synthase [Humitalea rosea]